MKRLSSEEVHAQKIAELGLDPTALDLTSVEGIACALRRAASFQCPCSATTLIRAVVRPLRGLVADLDSFRLLVEETLDAIIAHGDLHEHEDIGAGGGHSRARLLYAAPPGFVIRESGMVLLIGVASDQTSAIPEALHGRIQYVNHIRRIHALVGEDLRDELMQIGLVELSYEDWLKAPLAQNTTEYIGKFDGMLERAEASGDIPGLLLLDPERPVRYYRGRWVEPRSQSGRFVARRSQAYGADLWCFVRLQNGMPQRMVDLPLSPGRWRGCDEAWQLQLAIDDFLGHPQRYRLRPLQRGSVAMDIFSPLPMWARRRWDAIGEPVPSSGCLFAYRFADTEVDEEVRFAQETLWLRELPPRS